VYWLAVLLLLCLSLLGVFVAAWWLCVLAGCVTAVVSLLGVLLLVKVDKRERIK